jgi:CysZ protein
MLKNFSNAFFTYFEALRFITRKGLWGYAIVPGLVSIVIAVAAFYVAWQFSDELGATIIRWYPYEFGRGVIATIAGVGSSLLMFILFILVYKNLVVALVSPFLSPLSDAVAMELTGEVKRSEKSNFALIIRGLRLSLRNVFKELLFTLPLFLLALIPVVGLFFTILIFIIQAYYGGFGNFDYALERYYDRQKSIAFVRQNRSMTMGNGAGFLLLLLIPVVGIFLAPVLGAVAGSFSAIRGIQRNNNEQITNNK